MIESFQEFKLFGKEAFVKVTFNPPFKLSSTMNKGEACFFYLLDGESRVTSVDGLSSISSNEGVVLNCGNYISEYFSGRNAKCEALVVHFKKDIIQMVYKNNLPDFLTSIQNVAPVQLSKVKKDILVKNYIDSLMFYFDNPDLVSDELLTLKIKELLHLLAKMGNVDIIKSLISNTYSKERHDFTEVIEANLYSHLTLEELAYLLNMSLSTFKRTFTKYYNVSPAKYLRNRKLERAEKLLQATDRRVTDIAYESGFFDLAHFSKLFLKYKGLSPTSFRKTVQI